FTTASWLHFAEFARMGKFVQRAQNISLAELELKMHETVVSTMESPHRMRHNFHRVAILFAGGPAPGANAVISTAATAFLRNGVEVAGILHGYSHLVEYSPDRPLTEGRDYVMLNHRMLSRTRNAQGIIIGTARANP